MVLAIPEGDQGLAEYYVAQAGKAIHLPEELASCDDSCLIQPLSTVLNAVDQLGDIQGKSIAVIGLGSIGLFFCWLLKKRGAGHILGLTLIHFAARLQKSWEPVKQSQCVVLRSCMPPIKNRISGSRPTFASRQ